LKSKLKEYRLLRSLTQDELSKSSGISIRTIQRIEKGLSTGSPFTIKALAETLNIENVDLLQDENELKSFTENEKSKLQLLNFSVLTMLILPFGNIIFPSIIFYVNRNHALMNSVGKKILSFQIISMLALPFMLFLLFLFLGRGNGAVPLPITISYAVYGLVNIIISIKTSIEIKNEKTVLSFIPNIL